MLMDLGPDRHFIFVILLDRFTGLIMVDDGEVYTVV